MYLRGIEIVRRTRVRMFFKKALARIAAGVTFTECARHCW